MKSILIIADYERENLVFKEMVKVVITPMISSPSILNYADMDSRVSVRVWNKHRSTKYWNVFCSTCNDYCWS